jgi:L,D-transpeptidase YcbB
MDTKNFQIIAIIFIACTYFACVDGLKSNKQTVNTTDERPMATLLESTLENVNDSVYLAFRGNKLSTSKMIKEFYLLNKNYPVWTSGMMPNKDAQELMHLFSRAAYFGLDTSFYQYNEIKSLCSDLEAQKESNLNKKAIEFELIMTHNCFKLMSNLHSGITWGDTSIYGNEPVKYPSNYPKKLSRFINNGKLSQGILDLQPKSYEYKRLVKGLEQFLDRIVVSNDSFQMPNPDTDSAFAYQQARKILINENYLHTIKQLPEQVRFSMQGIYLRSNKKRFSIASIEDSLFMNALKEFQKEHGLKPDGKIGFYTTKALIKNNCERFEQIAVNIERLKWEKNRPAKYVYVNVPAYKLRVINEHSVVKTFNVVVGTPATPTPLMNSNILYFITNPQWNVPYSISSKELLPKIKKDSSYLARHNYKIYDKDRKPVEQVNWSEIDKGNFNYSLQQASGTGNALGKIKFFIPNPNSILIHDTNDKSKFKNDIKAYSHGCMRVQNPNELAKLLLTFEPDNMADSVDVLLSRGISKKIDFKEPVPVYVRYITCEADSKGKIIFYHDIYGKDSKLKDQLFAKRDI